MSRSRRLVLVAAVGGVTVALGSCAGPRAAHTRAGAPPASRSAALQDRIAHELTQSSPASDPTDAAERDAAAERLARCVDLLNASGERVLWGAFDPAKGFDLNAYRLTEFSPVVWTKLYLSTFMFPGPYEVRREDKYTVLRIDARFRGGLDPGDYPYPFWHSAAKWQSYAETGALLLVFENDRFVAALRDPRATAGAAVAAKPWDGHWRWTDAQGHEQPRVALYSYVLSSDNPSITSLDHAYRKLEAAVRGQNCVGCHAPDNVANANPLLLLNYPNQALVARHTLVDVLRRNRMPPADVDAGVEAGITDEAVRQDLLRLAEEFERQADAALAYEHARTASDNSQR